LIAAVTAVGVGQSIAVGSFFQLVANFPPSCTPFLFMGNGLSSIIMFFITLGLGLLKDASHPTQIQLYIYWFSIAGILVVCLFMFFVLLNSNMFAELLKQRGEEERESLLTDEYKEILKPKNLSFTQLISATKIPCISIFLNFFTTLLLISFYSYVPSNGKFTSLVQILNYSSLIADFFGRQLVLLRGQKWLLIKNSKGVLVTVLLRCTMTVVFFVYLMGISYRDDYIAVIFIAVYSLAGGYSNTLIYIYGSSEVPPSQSSRAASMINLALQGGVALAIVAEFSMDPFIPKPHNT